MLEQCVQSTKQKKKSPPSKCIFFNLVLFLFFFFCLNRKTKSSLCALCVLTVTVCVCARALSHTYAHFCCVLFGSAIIPLCYLLLVFLSPSVEWKLSTPKRNHSTTTVSAAILDNVIVKCVCVCVERALLLSHRRYSATAAKINFYAHTLDKNFQNQLQKKSITSLSLLPLMLLLLLLLLGLCMFALAFFSAFDYEFLSPISLCCIAAAAAVCLL